MTEVDESEILEEIVEPSATPPKAQNPGSTTPKARAGRHPAILSVKIPVKESIADEDLSEEETVEKIKAPRTQKQIDAFKKVIEKKMENAMKRQIEKKLQEEKDKKELEAKIIKKAVSIKKKQIKKQTVLEEISDDETPIEVIKEMNVKLNKVIKPAEKPKPKFIFV